MLTNGARMREFAGAYVSSRAHVGLPPVSVEDVVYARAVEIVAERMRRVDLLTGRDVAAAVRSTKAEVRREDRQQQFDELVKAIVVHFHQDSARLDAKAAMENRARAHRGMPRVPAESLVVQLALQDVIERVPTSKLTKADARSAVRIAGLHIATTLESRDLVDRSGHRRALS